MKALEHHEQSDRCPGCYAVYWDYRGKEDSRIWPEAMFYSESPLGQISVRMQIVGAQFMYSVGLEASTGTFPTYLLQGTSYKIKSRITKKFDDYRKIKENHTVKHLQNEV
jgi:hypothetical protein